LFSLRLSFSNCLLLLLLQLIALFWRYQDCGGETDQAMPRPLLGTQQAVAPSAVALFTSLLGYVTPAPADSQNHDRTTFHGHREGNSRFESEKIGPV